MYFTTIHGSGSTSFWNILILFDEPLAGVDSKGTSKILNLIKQSIDVNLKFIYGSASSDSLLKWSDIVIDVGTSVTWEPVKKGKPVLMLEYLHSNYSTVASYIKASEIKYRDELYDTINKFIKRKNMKFYKKGSFIKNTTVSDKTIRIFVHTSPMRDTDC